MGQRQRYTLDEIEVGECYQILGNHHVRVLSVVREQAPPWQKQASRALLHCLDLNSGLEVNIQARDFWSKRDSTPPADPADQGDASRLRDVLRHLGITRDQSVVHVREGKLRVTILLSKVDLGHLANLANGIEEST